MKTLKITYKGKEYPSLTALAKSQKMNYYTLHWRLYKMGMSVEEAVDTKLAMTRKHPPYKVHGVDYYSLRELAEAEGVSINTLRSKAYKAGYDNNKLALIVAELQRVVQDHKGKEYRSYSAMCRAYDIKLSTFLNRLNEGKSIEYALTHPVGKQGRHAKEAR